MALPPDSPLPTIDALTFDASSLRYLGEKGNERQWSTPEDDLLCLSFHGQVPDLPANSRHLFQLFDAVEREVTNETVKLVELDTPEVGGMTALWLILKIPRQPSGRTYLGSLTLPFARCSYVLKLQCEERGVTGLRETAALAKSLETGEICLDEEGAVLESVLADETFPGHPLSRLRRVFRELAPSIRLHPDLQREPAFPLIQRLLK